MRPSTADNNRAHYDALAIVEAFEKSGGKVQRLGTATRSVAKSTINKKTAKKENVTSELKGMGSVEKVFFLIKKHKTLTRDKIEELTGGMDRSEIFRAARKLQNDGLITREKRSGTGFGRQVQFILV